MIPTSSPLSFCYFFNFQMELKVTEYHKLARKLKLIPLSAENACGHDFEIKSFECGSGSGVQQKTQIKVLPLMTVQLKEGLDTLSVQLQLSESVIKNISLFLELIKVFCFFRSCAVDAFEKADQ